jgi:uncharacterized damage-inducible protein DinB
VAGEGLLANDGWVSGESVGFQAGFASGESAAVRLDPVGPCPCLGYSHGSVRDQIVHLMSVDELWFSELRSVEPSEPFPPAHVDDREIIRTHWDSVEQRMRAYLAELRDEMLFAKPIEEPEEDKDLSVWQVLLHVVNHGTDHRAQVLRLLNDLGVKTTSQDYIFYVYDHV